MDVGRGREGEKLHLLHAGGREVDVHGEDPDILAVHLSGSLRGGDRGAPGGGRPASPRRQWQRSPSGRRRQGSPPPGGSNNPVSIHVLTVYTAQCLMLASDHEAEPSVLHIQPVENKASSIYSLREAEGGRESSHVPKAGAVVIGHERAPPRPLPRLLHASARTQQRKSGRDGSRRRFRRQAERPSRTPPAPRVRRMFPAGDRFVALDDSLPTPIRRTYGLLGGG
jgi:hypothetical protein